MNRAAFDAWLSNPAGIWPWAENNQGFLTVFALGVALTVSVFELVRAARWQERELSEFIDYVLNSADRGIELTGDAIRTIDGTVAEIDRMPIPTWSFLQQNAVGVLREALPIRPANAGLALLVNQLERIMSVPPDHAMFEHGERSALVSILFSIEVQRAKIVLFRPPSFIERLRRLLRISDQKYPTKTPISDGLRYPPRPAADRTAS